MTDSKHSSTGFRTSKKRKGFRTFAPRKKQKLTQKVNRVSIILRRLQKAREVKIHSLGQTLTSVTASGFVSALANISQGDTGVLRDGNSLSIFSIDVRWEMFRNSLDTASSFRLLIFRDRRQIKNNQPGVTDVLASSGPLSQLNADNRTRFEIWYDVTGSIGIYNPSYHGHFHRKVQIKQEYYASGSGNLLANGVYLLIVCDETVNFPTFGRTSRVLFNDY